MTRTWILQGIANATVLPAQAQGSVGNIASVDGIVGITAKAARQAGGSENGARLAGRMRYRQAAYAARTVSYE